MVAKFILVFVAASLSVSQAWSQTYRLESDVVDGGGVRMSSSGYVLRGSFGQPTVGKLSSASYIAYIGFWHPPYGSGPGIEEHVFVRKHVPLVFSLSQNHPNPVVHSTTIKYGLPRRALVDISLFNSAGQRMRTLVEENQKPGYYKIRWDLRGVFGEHLPNGVYFYRIRACPGRSRGAGGFIATRKMVILR
ncbi:MAG: hypothetical protein ACE5JA_08735 [bacterium]